MFKMLTCANTISASVLAICNLELTLQDFPETAYVFEFVFSFSV